MIFKTSAKVMGFIGEVAVAIKTACLRTICAALTKDLSGYFHNRVNKTQC